MNWIATARMWFQRMAVAAPSAWNYDPVFRWSAICAGVALALFVLRLTDFPFSYGSSPVPAASVPVSLGTSYGTAAGSSPAPPGPIPALQRAQKIAPGRSLDGVAITPAPERDPFGTVPSSTHP
jgi:hypothetical protein